MTGILTPAVFTIALVSVGFTEVIKKNLPDATPNWVLSLINLVTAAVATVAWTAMTPDVTVLKALTTGAMAFAVAQVEYNYLFKLFTSAIGKLKGDFLEKDIDSETDNTVAEHLKG